MNTGMLFIFFICLFGYTTATPVAAAAVEANSSVNASLAERALKCHFTLELERNCGGGGYMLMMHDIIAPQGYKLKGIENQDKWLYNIEDKEVTIGKIQNSPLTAKYSVEDDDVHFAYWDQQWWDFNCPDRDMHWGGDDFKGDLNYCPYKWTFYGRRVKCYFTCNPRYRED